VQSLLHWKSNKCFIFCGYACSLRYPACKGHASNCHLSPLLLHNIFAHYLINGTIFEIKRVTVHKIWALIFSTISVWDIPHSKKNWTRYDHKCLVVFMYSTGYSCRIFTKFEFSTNVFEKYSNFIKCHENPSSGSRVVPCGQTDRQTDMTKLIVAFRNCANAPETCSRFLRIFTILIL